MTRGKEHVRAGEEAWGEGVREEKVVRHGGKEHVRAGEEAWGVGAMEEKGV